jgi:hypothetical protein
MGAQATCSHGWMPLYPNRGPKVKKPRGPASTAPLLCRKSQGQGLILWVVLVVATFAESSTLPEYTKTITGPQAHAPDQGIRAEQLSRMTVLSNNWR